MTNTCTVFLYVTNPLASADYYSTLLGTKPVEASPGFALFILPSGLGLGLWAKVGVQPAPAAGGGGSEIGFKLNSAAQVDSIHADWCVKGAEVIFPPTDLDFGRSFVAVDPDGNRLRVYALAEEV